MLQAEQILFEDNHLIIINKKPGQIVQGDKTGDTPLSELLKQYLKEKYKKPGNVFVGVAHRLDRPVSGAIIFAKTSKALSRINELLREHSMHKTYWAICINPPKETSGKLVHYLKKNEANNKSFAQDEEKEGYLKAVLNYKHLASSDKYHLLEVNLETGRHHQIRVQLAKVGCTIKGDLKYGAARSNPDASISLHARKLSFIHPVSKEKITVTAPVPNDNLWNAFIQMKC